MKTKRELKSMDIGALPVVNKYIEDCRFHEIFERFMPSAAGTKLSSADVVVFLLRNIMLASYPLYKLSEWACNYPARLLGLAQADMLNDDRVGRALEKLFLADRSTMVTEIALHIIKHYEIEMSTCHNDSTSISFYGAYKRESKFEKKPAALQRGFNKDHRPDLKQLIFNLVVAGDGAMPIHYMLYDGNVTDDTTHRNTWDSLRALVGHPDFIYVADSKLCTAENMAHIDNRGGRFITVMPQTRKEHTRFVQWVQEHPVEGQPMRYRNPNTSKPDSYRGYESPAFTSEEGFRIIWIRSTQKRRLDAESRNNRIQAVKDKLTELSGKLNRYYLKSKKNICQQVEEILKEHKMKDCFDYTIKTSRTSSKKKISPGRPGPASGYALVTKNLYNLNWSVNKQVVEKKSNADGFFPLITNVKNMDMRTILKHYKYQPHLEKRHSYLKSLLNVAPVYLKMPERIEALLFLYYLALMLYALIERDMRKSMKQARLKSIPIYPEKRECRRPSAERILDILKNISVHELRENDKLTETFFDELSDLQVNVLNLLEIPTKHYGR